MPLGVPVGVELGLSTRTLRDPDLGVMLWLRNVETGVETSSFPTGVVLLSGRADLRDEEVPVFDGVEPATLGVNGIRLTVLVEALRVGMSGLEALCLSYGGILFGLPFVKGGTRIMALPSLDWRGGRRDCLDGRSRVGVAFVDVLVELNLFAFVFVLLEFESGLLVWRFLERAATPNKVARMLLSEYSTTQHKAHQNVRKCSLTHATPNRNNEIKDIQIQIQDIETG